MSTRGVPAVDIATVKDPNRLMRYLSSIEQQLMQAINTARQAPATTNSSTFIDLQRIREQLSSNGQYPLNVEGLTGILADSQIAGLVITSSLPSVSQYPIGTLLVVTGSPDVFYYLKKGTPNTWQAITMNVADNAITNAKLRDSAALSVIGRNVNSVGDPADIAASADGQFLQRIAGTLGWAIPAISSLSDGSAIVTLAGSQVLTNKTLTAPNIDDMRSVSRITGANTLAPTITGTGFGATPTYALFTGSSDAIGSVSIIPGGGGIAANGTLTITFSGASTYGPNSVTCVAMLGTGGAAWNARATVQGGTVSNTAVTLNWDNNAVALTAAVGYRIHWICMGK